MGAQLSPPQEPIYLPTSLLLPGCKPPFTEDSHGHLPSFPHYSCHQLWWTECLHPHLLLPTKLICWIPNTQGDGIGRRCLERGLAHEGGALMTGLLPLKKGPQRNVLPATRRYNKQMAVCDPEEGSLRNLTMPANASPASSLQDGEKHSSGIYDPVCGTLSWRPKHQSRWLQRTCGQFHRPPASQVLDLSPRGAGSPPAQLPPAVTGSQL